MFFFQASYAWTNREFLKTAHERLDNDLFESCLGGTSTPYVKDRGSLKFDCDTERDMILFTSI